MSAWPVTADAVIRRALRDVGLGEYPPRSNRNKITAWYGIGPGAWCAMAVAYWFAEEGCEIRDRLGARETAGRAGWAYTPVGVQAAKRAGLWHKGAEGLKRGDVVFYKLPGAEGSDYVNHVGIVTSVTSVIRSIEGNTANIVAERVRGRAPVVGYMRPPYSTGTPKPKPVPVAPPFPGAGAFRIGKSSPAVTLLDRQLVRTGFAMYHDGDGYQPGPVFTKHTRANVRSFQRAQGWTGADADGVPGPETWERIHKSPTRTVG
ncbi:hypothetical protein GCM10010387_67600 [Streptomyces inusitatus]|uniref:CHAP domain-containing protein n=1 Tax=Streptomyces inusitatus TaxID=68221 RepID=A0A918QPZ4_9ACTN|nr:peptidoglycan-binding protein [Streptomyces inusitatus]GGZ64991.1 hypothetical protein GCM10010387_67600 [Streptomyces inusitatus]